MALFGLDDESIGRLLEGFGQGLERFGNIRETRRQESQKQRERERRDEVLMERMKAVQDRIDERARKTRMASKEGKITERAFKVEEEAAKGRIESRKAARKADIAQTKTALAAETKEREKKEAAEAKAGSFEGRYDSWLAGTYEPKTKQERRAFEKKAGVKEKKPEGETGLSRDDLFKMWQKMSPEDKQWWGDKGIEEFSDFVDFYEENVQDIEPFAGLPTIQAGSQGEMGGPGLPEGAALPQPLPPPQTGNQGLDVYNYYQAQGVQGISPEDFMPAGQPPDLGPAELQMPGQIPDRSQRGVTEQLIPGQDQAVIRQQATTMVSGLPGFDKMPAVQQQALIELKMRELMEGQ